MPRRLSKLVPRTELDRKNIECTRNWMVMIAYREKAMHPEKETYRRIEVPGFYVDLVTHHAISGHLMSMGPIAVIVDESVAAQQCPVVEDAYDWSSRESQVAINLGNEEAYNYRNLAIKVLEVLRAEKL